MNVTIVRTSYPRTFNGADVDQRFARDDSAEDEALFERRLHLAILPEQIDQDEQEQTDKDDKGDEE